MIPSLFQWLTILGISSVKSKTVKFLNPEVCVDNIADGRITVSIPNAGKTDNATVVEQLP